MQAVYSTLIQVCSIAELCAERGTQLPALILAYSGMDALAWMGASDPKARVRDRFVAWVEKYALPAVPTLRCTSLELYAARCAILHTLTADSELTDRGVRKLVYAWGKADPADLQAAAAAAGSTKWVAVHVADITAALRLGTAQMFEDAQQDPALGARIAQRGQGYFAPMSEETLRALMDREPAA